MLPNVQLGKGGKCEDSSIVFLSFLFRGSCVGRSGGDARRGGEGLVGRGGGGGGFLSRGATAHAQEGLVWFGLVLIQARVRKNV